jgi:hypothetical protein
MRWVYGALLAVAAGLPLGLIASGVESAAFAGGRTFSLSNLLGKDQARIKLRRGEPAVTIRAPRSEPLFKISIHPSKMAMLEMHGKLDKSKKSVLYRVNPGEYFVAPARASVPTKAFEVRR